MANKRDTSKQKRARENRAQREALKARTTAASTDPEERRTKATSTADAPSTKASRAAERSARTRPVRPGDVPVDVAALEGNFLSKRNHVPGGRQVMFAFVITLITSITLAVGKYPPDDDPDGKRTLSFFEAAGPAAWPLLLVPPVVVAVALALSLHPKRRRIWLACTVALGALTVAALAIYTVNLLALGFMIYGIQRASRVEGPMAGGRPRRARRGATEPAAEASAPAADDA